MGEPFRSWIWSTLEVPERGNGVEWNYTGGSISIPIDVRC